MSETFTCTRCQREALTDERMYMGTDELCTDCYDELTTVCERCGERIWQDDSQGDDNITLCQQCYDEYYTSCEDCGRLIHNDDVYYIDDDDNYPYCRECYNRRQNSSYIHDYGYKPYPIFYGDGDRYFGVELEIDYAGKDDNNAEVIAGVANRNIEHIYIKSDGSLDDGMELVTHPMSLEYHMKEMPWHNILEKVISLKYKSHKTSTCGLHCHINRNSLGSDYEEQEENIAKVLYFVEHHWLELLRFSRRTEQQMKRWANRYVYKDTPKEILDTAKRGYSGRYSCVNIQNRDTIEFRMFRGTLKYNTLIATLQLVNEICNVAIFMSDENLSNLSWLQFVEGLNPEKTPELITYLKERRLYLNDVIACEEDE